MNPVASPDRRSRLDGSRGVLAALAVWFSARALSLLTLAELAGHQGAIPPSYSWHLEGSRPGNLSWWQLLSNWDGQWYKTIALHGYAVGLQGLTVESPLPFYPIYPLLVRFGMWATGGSFEVVGSIVSLAAGTIAVALLFRWVASTRGPSIAMVGVAVLSFFPSALALQAAYSDSLALVLLVPILRAAVERRWAVALIESSALYLIRPIMLPVAAFVALLEGWRYIRDGSHQHRDLCRGLGVAATMAVLAFAWPTVVAFITGEPTAYFQAYSVWARAGGNFGGWVTGLWELGHPLLAVTFVGLTLALISLRWRHRGDDGHADRLGMWAGIYAIYILLTTTISTSIFRHALMMLLPLGSLGPMTARPLERRVRLWLTLGVVVVEVILQIWWIDRLFLMHRPANQLGPP